MALAGCLEQDTLGREKDKEAQSQKPYDLRKLKTPSETLEKHPDPLRVTHTGSVGQWQEKSGYQQLIVLQHKITILIIVLFLIYKKRFKYIALKIKQTRVLFSYMQYLNL